MAQDSDSLPETLDSPVAVDRQPPGQLPGDPSLSRNVSFSRLNAKAPEFVPRAADPAQPRLAIRQPSPPLPAPGLVHVYNASPPSTNPTAYHVQIPSHVPLQVTVPGQNHHAYSRHVPVQQYNHQNQSHHNQNQRQPFGGGGSGITAAVEQQEAAGGSGVQGQCQGQARRRSQSPVEADHAAAKPARNGGLSEEATQKILNQVEYYFSDINLATTEHLMRFISKDPEGYVPISVVASFKKIKALVSSNSQLASVLRNSTKIVVSEDGKKVKREVPLTESDMDELQSRIVVAENLPEDHCHQNLMKIFLAVGSVKSIRTCIPQTSNGGASSASRTSKTDGMLLNNKLHAFVEYESVELAEKAVAELTEEGNWRNGLRVRLLLRRTSKPIQARAKKVGHEGEAHRKEDDASTSEQQHPNEKHIEDPSYQPDAQLHQSHEHAEEEHSNGKDGGQKKGRNRGRGKGRGRPQYQNNHQRGGHGGTPPSNNLVNTEHPPVARQPPGPRMPDGTRGFSLGRGKPLAVNIV
ncbi:hypothetical protein RJ639_032927 [Escallonia herrerae]|uniref:La-related protein 6B n=1 Tax=Escallonia herrerae TaxID=1293975 RepID=A0AA89B9S1_9ASTE|nr:hypothetical protein RJ639_032927 [Escallonia herrerae]